MRMGEHLPVGSNKCL